MSEHGTMNRPEFKYCNNRKKKEYISIVCDKGVYEGKDRNHWPFWFCLAFSSTNTLFDNLTTGASQLSAENKTLISGFIAVISVNLVIGFYICMAMKESPSSTNPQPDPKFLAEAKASINQSENAASSSIAVDQTSGKDSDQNKGKME